MNYRVIVHQQTKDDLVRNANWWADNHSTDQALSWLDTVEKQLQELSVQPERFGVSPENNLFHYEIRQMLDGLGNRRRYRAIYTVRRKAVHVLTIRRAEQDQLQADDLPNL